VGTNSAYLDGMFPPLAEIERLTETVIGCAIEVHKALGAGLLESVYRECMCIELMNARLYFESERHIHLTYKGLPIKQAAP
jgi:GxxExxY protein